MGFFQATNGIDSKSTVLVTGSVFGSANATFIGTISGSTISSSGDIVAEDDIFVKNMDTGAIPERIVAISATNGQLFYVPTGSFQIPAIVDYEVQTGGTASYTAATTPSVAQLNGGFVTIVPTSTPMISFDLSGITTDYRVEIISYGTGVNDQRLNLQIRTPNTGNGWTGYLTGWYTDVAQSAGYQWITAGNGNTLFNTLAGASRRLDSSSRTLIAIDISNKNIMVHSTNISD
jgi:uncharacterized protein with LGFP repeats